MALNFTPAGSTPEKSQNQAPAKYVPQRSSPSMAGNTAPIGSEETPTRRQAAPAGTEQAQEQGDEGGEDELAARADLTKRLGLLSEKDRQARARLEEAKQAEGRLQARLDEITAREKKLQDEDARRAEWRRNPKKLLEDHNFVPEAALQFLMAGEKLTPDQQLAINLEDRLAQERAQREQDLKTLREEQDQQRTKDAEEQQKRDQQELQHQEQLAIQELEADIGDILSGDAKGYALIMEAEKRGQGRGVMAVYDRVNAIAAELHQQNGRWPPITTKMLERAASEVEAAARKELQETMANPELAEAIGMTRRPLAPRQNTLTNRMAPAVSTGQRVEETEAEKRERVKSMISPLLRGGRVR